MPDVKSRGFGISSSAAGPLPSPFSPWQPDALELVDGLAGVRVPGLRADERGRGEDEGDDGGGEDGGPQCAVSQRRGC